ncbi:unnamed protein product [Allacma fusca]|uniref:Peptidase S1 domain-containing protein n=1 Tax=Allacma fusca TaxID=39272 RepID=A0A8J2L8V6_9HEXA|nr:unnamed protein product [Allacma fusca]
MAAYEGVSAPDTLWLAFNELGLVELHVIRRVGCRLGRQIHGKWRRSVNASAFQVIAGIDSVDLRNFDDFSQTMKVTSIQINPKNEGFYHYCNALMQLENPLQFNTSYVKPICLPNFKPPEEQGNRGFGFSGFGQLSNYAEGTLGTLDGFRHLNSKRVSLASHPYCLARTHNSENYCGVPRPGSGSIRDTCTSQAIATAQVSANNAWYLLGLGTKYTSQICSIRKLDDDPGLPWIMNSIRCGSQGFPCRKDKCIRLSKVCDSNRDCPNGEDEDPGLCRGMNPCINEATFQCGVYESCIKYENVCDGFPDCLDASDEDPDLCKLIHRKKATPFNSDPPVSPSSPESTTAVSLVSTAPVIRVPTTTQTIPTQSTRLHEVLPIHPTVPSPKVDVPGVTTTAPVTPTVKQVPSASPHPIQEHTSMPSTNTDIARVTQSHDLECPALDASEGVTSRCALPSGESSSCSGRQPIGTVATLKCKILYKPASSDVPFITKKCRRDHRWKPERVFECFPDCGRLLTSGNNAYIVNGLSLTPKDQFPWHAAIFTKYRNRWEYICGGTLIRRSYILTAAHCVTDYNGDNNKQPDAFKIALAPTSSKFDTLYSDPNVQIYDVRKILVHDRYDPTNNYQADIALIALKSPAAINPKVLMACLPYSDSVEPSPGTLGQVAGFGVDETGKISDELKFANLPVVGVEECIKSVNFIPSVNQLCAGYANGTGVCFGDSGGGLVFKMNQRYFLYGIVSVGPRSGRRKRSLTCNQKTYSVFTSVARFVDWVTWKINFLETEM